MDSCNRRLDFRRFGIRDPIPNKPEIHVRLLGTQEVPLVGRFLSTSFCSLSWAYLDFNL